jgi:hypothetical protein
MRLRHAGRRTYDKEDRMFNPGVSGVIQPIIDLGADE